MNLRLDPARTLCGSKGQNLGTNFDPQAHVGFVQGPTLGSKGPYGSLRREGRPTNVGVALRRPSLLYIKDYPFGNVRADLGPTWRFGVQIWASGPCQYSGQGVIQMPLQKHGANTNAITEAMGQYRGRGQYRGQGWEPSKRNH